MQLIDVKFDGGQGDANVSLAPGGVLLIKESDTNPNAQSQAQVSVPIQNIFDAIKKKANNFWVSGALSFAMWVIKKMSD